jgi:hypothetical protein
MMVAALDEVSAVLGSDDWVAYASLGQRFALPQAGPFSTTLGSLSRTPIIPATFYGATFVFNESSDTYEEDATRSGAPLDGVRFVLYDVDAGGQPIVAAERGYADVDDPGSALAEGFAIHIVATGDGPPFADYTASFGADALAKTRVTGSAAFDHLGLEINGFLASLDLDIVTGEADGIEITEFQADLADLGAIIRGIVSGDTATASFDIAASVTIGAHELRVGGLSTAGAYSGEVFANGTSFATFDTAGQTVTVVVANTANVGPEVQDAARKLAFLATRIRDIIDGLVIALL